MSTPSGWRVEPPRDRVLRCGEPKTHISRSCVSGYGLTQIGSLCRACTARLCRPSRSRSPAAQRNRGWPHRVQYRPVCSCSPPSPARRRSVARRYTPPDAFIVSSPNARAGSLSRRVASGRQKRRYGARVHTAKPVTALVHDCRQVPKNVLMSVDGSVSRLRYAQRRQPPCAVSAFLRRLHERAAPRETSGAGVGERDVGPLSGVR